LSHSLAWFFEALKDEGKQSQLSENIKQLAMP
jgi:hypothetical protein